MSEPNFIDACLAGDALLVEIDDYVDRWHEGNGFDVELPVFLGFSEEEYSLWVERPSSLRWIIAARNRNKPLKAFLIEAGTAAVAARTADANEAKRLVQWLQATGRI